MALPSNSGTNDHRICCPPPTTIYLSGISGTGKSIVELSERTQTASTADSTALLSGLGEAAAAYRNGEMDLPETGRSLVKAREKVKRFLEFGVRHFIDLTESGEYGLLPYEAILSEESRTAGISATYRRFPMRDVSVPRDADHLGEVLLTIYRRIREGEAVFVYCWGGVGRTGLVVGCWLQEHGRSPDAALAELRAKWSMVERALENRNRLKQRNR